MDVQYTREEYHIDTTVYRKTKCNLIPRIANVSINHKKAGIRAQVQRALRLCSTTEGVNDETNTIKKYSQDAWL